jgi:uncharacterized membrane protein (DUF2068 family)
MYRKKLGVMIVDFVNKTHVTDGALTFLTAHRQLEIRHHAKRIHERARVGRGAGEGGCLQARAWARSGKSLLFLCLGFGAIHLLHKDLGDEVTRLATALKFDPESRFVSLLLDKVDLIDTHQLREISLATFGYSALALTEGVGLLLEKVWAEYLTLILTISFLPWELYELARRPSWFRLSLLLINLAVLAYLVWLLRRKKLLGEEIV